MPSFDIVSKVNIQEVDNAVNSVLRELTNRYDFKGAIFSVELKAKENIINISADSEYKLEAVRDSLKVLPQNVELMLRLSNLVSLKKLAEQRLSKK